MTESTHLPERLLRFLPLSGIDKDNHSHRNNLSC